MKPELTDATLDHVIEGCRHTAYHLLRGLTFKADPTAGLLYKAAEAIEQVKRERDALSRPAPAEDQVERVARALFEASYERGADWESADAVWRDDYRKMARAALSAALPGEGELAPKGWRLVPVEPTEAMIEAGWIDKEDVNPDEIYIAMLSTAPSPPARETETLDDIAKAHDDYYDAWLQETRAKAGIPPARETDEPTIGEEVLYCPKCGWVEPVDTAPRVPARETADSDSEMVKAGNALDLAVSQFLDADKAWSNDELDESAYCAAFNALKPALYAFRAALSNRPAAVDAEGMRERAAKVADKHRARIEGHCPDTPMSDKVAQGYGNAALNIGCEIRRLPLTTEGE